MPKSGYVCMLERQIKELAKLDWSNTPQMDIRARFEGRNWETIMGWRLTPVYQLMMKELRDAQVMEYGKLPMTEELRTRITHLMTLSINALGRIITPGSGAEHKDQIAAARLIAQLDGRFIGPDDQTPAKRNPHTESLAQALLTEMKKGRDTIQ